MSTLITVTSLIVVLFVGTVSSAIGQEDAHFDQPDVYFMKVNGVVSKIVSGVVFVKTPWGNREVIPNSHLHNIKMGEEVTLYVDMNNAVIDVNRKGHQVMMTGKLEWASSDEKEIRLWTPEGEKNFQVAKSALLVTSLKEGTPITVVLVKDWVVNVYPAQFDGRLGHDNYK